MITINNIWGDLSDVSAKTATFENHRKLLVDYSGVCILGGRQQQWFFFAKTSINSPRKIFIFIIIIIYFLDLFWIFCIFWFFFPWIFPFYLSGFFLLSGFFGFLLDILDFLDFPGFFSIFWILWISFFNNENK